MVIPQGVVGTVHEVQDAVVAAFTCSVDTAETETKGTVLMKTADDLLSYNLGEEKFLEGIIRSLSEAGVNVVVSGSNIGDMALHFLEKYKIMALKITSKFELRRICKATGARALVTFGPATPDVLGHCASVQQTEMGATKTTVFRQPDRDAAISTIVLRGNTQNTLNDLERAVDDGINVVKALCRDPRFVPGAGATETEMARQIMQFASKHEGMEQYAIKAFGQALQVIPRTLAENTGHHGTHQEDILPKLMAAHERKMLKLRQESAWILKMAV
eukprot:GABV01000869.1.p1 GENE.GABV01000869.1~~GABV01000869.1.p1  ORF type:complete len:312 (-),score=104.28 GABV01000869.1:145-966(-)